MDEVIAARDALLEVRRRGADAAVMLLFEDVRADMSRRAAFDISRQIESYDMRRLYMEGIEKGTLDVVGQTLLERCVYDPTRLGQLRHLLTLASTVVVRSFEELRRIRKHVGPVRCNVTRWFPRRDLPTLEHSKREKIVLWSADDPGDLTAIGAFALEQGHREVVIVAPSAPNFPTPFRYVPADDPDVANVLATAACIVDLSVTDPSWACAFAKRGFPVVAASTAGASEVLEGLPEYDPWSFRSIAASVAQAVCGKPAHPLEIPDRPSDIVSSLERMQVDPPARAPLVSIIIPTYNRRVLVEQAVRRLGDQYYARLEILVVNDGGEDVSHLALLDPRVRVVNAEVNGGPAAAVNLGLREAKGEYVEWVADDDVIYPDHVLRCVAALETSGAVVAHSNAALCLAKAKNESVIYDLNRFSGTVDLSEAYAYHHVARFMIRRAELLEIGALAEDLFVCDLEVLIRIAERFDFVHVPMVTAESWLRFGEQQFSTRPGLDHAVELQKMFERHPATGRVYVEALRKRTLENLRSGNRNVAY